MSEDRTGHQGISGPATRAIHAGYRPDPATGAVNVPQIQRLLTAGTGHPSFVDSD
ncbi:hypothetical protein GR254_07185 [Mycobacterium tuberculosis]|nr:hypothetical protein [Mycobacterium tuberculosis]